jgi:hypothetical protein
MIATLRQSLRLRTLAGVLASFALLISAVEAGVDRAHMHASAGDVPAISGAATSAISTDHATCPHCLHAGDQVGEGVLIRCVQFKTVGSAVAANSWPGSGRCALTPPVRPPIL